MFLCNEVAYHNFAVHFSVNPIARTSSKSCEDWTEQIFLIDQRINDFFSLCSPSCKSSIHANSCWLCWSPDEIVRLSLHSCTSFISRRAKFCSLRSQFFRAFQFFLKFSLGCVTASFVLFHLLSLALTRFNSRHCSVFGTISPPFLNCPGPRTLFRDLATFSAVNSCSVAVSFMLCLR